MIVCRQAGVIHIYHIAAFFIAWYNKNTESDCLTAFRLIGTKRDGAATSVINSRFARPNIDDKKW